MCDYQGFLNRPTPAQIPFLYNTPKEYNDKTFTLSKQSDFSQYSE